MASQSEDQPGPPLLRPAYIAIYSLQLGTASGPDQIQPKHQRHGGTLASFPGPAQLSVASSTEKRERGWYLFSRE